MQSITKHKSKFLILFCFSILISSCSPVLMSNRKKLDVKINSKTYTKLKGIYLNKYDSTKTVVITPIHEKAINISYQKYGEEYRGLTLTGKFINGYFISKISKERNGVLLRKINTNHMVVGLSKNDEIIIGHNTTGYMYALFFPIFGAGDQYPRCKLYKRKSIYHRGNCKSFLDFLANNNPLC